MSENNSKSMVITHSKECRILVAALFSLLFVGNANAANLYRYKNSDGNTVIDHRVPAMYVAEGYEILNSNGQVIEVIPPTTASEEAAGVNDIKEKRAQAREDRFILASYSSVQDIDDARIRKTEQIEREINLVKSKLEDTRKQQIREQARAANYQRSGKEVPETITGVLKQLEEQEVKVEQLLLVRQNEVIEAQELYDRYKKRFLQLVDVGADQLAESPDSQRPSQ